MTGVFCNLYDNAKTGTLTAIRGAYTSPLSTVLTAVNKFKTYLESNIPKMTNVITGLLIDPDMISDQLALSSVIDLNDQHYGTTSYDIFHAIITAWQQSADSEGYLTLTGYNGEVYQFYITSSVDVSDILTNITDASDPRYGHGVTRQISEDDWFLKKEGSEFRINNVILDVNGNPHCLYDLLNYLIASNEVNECILEFSQLVSSGVVSGDAYVTKASEYAQSKYNAVKDTAKSLRLAFATGGIYGLCKAILSYTEAATQLTDDNGVLQFTDNSKFIPQEYIVGLLSSILNTVAQVAAAIIAIFSRILGVIASIAVQAIQSLIQAISFDYTGTLGQLTEGNCIPGSTPYGIFQAIVPLENIPSSIHDGLLLGYPLVCIDVVGGQLIFGYGQFDSDGHPTHLNVEFHPSLSNSHDFWDYVLGMLSSHSTARTGVTYDRVELSYQFDETFNDYELDTAFYQITHGNSDTYALTNDENTGYLSELDDQEVRCYIIQNMILFLLYYRTNTTPNVFISASGSLPLIYQYNEPLSGGASRNVFAFGDVEAFAEGLFDFSSVSALQSSLPNLMMLGLLLDNWDLAFDEVGSDAALQGARLDAPYYAQIANFATKWSSISSVNTILVRYDWLTKISNGYYFGNQIELSGSVEFSLKVPKYSRATFWKWVGLTAAIGVIAVGATIGIALTLRKVIQHKQAVAAAKVYKAADDFQHDQSVANYKAYRKAVFKNNLLARLTGGTKYDKINVWNGSNDSKNSSSVLTDKVASQFALIGNDPEYGNLSDSELTREQILQIRYLIKSL